MALPDLWLKLKEGAKTVVRLRKTVGEFCAAKLHGSSPGEGPGDSGGKVFTLVSAALRRLRDMPPGRQRLAFIGFGAFLAALLLFLVILLTVSRDGSVREAAAPETPVRIIPPEDIFLPEEPDFIPSFIPGRERREFWTGEDAAAWWQDPLRGGEEEWRNRIESVVDGILERVP
jgi:hypothetical protein